MKRYNNKACFHYCLVNCDGVCTFISQCNPSLIPVFYYKIWTYILLHQSIFYKCFQYMVFIVFRTKYLKGYLYSIFIFNILIKMLSIYNLIDNIMKGYKKYLKTKFSTGTLKLGVDCNAKTIKSCVFTMSIILFIAFQSKIYFYNAE